MVTMIIDDEMERRLEAVGATTEPVKVQFVRAAIAEAVQRIEEQELEAERWARVEGEIESAFAGPTVELTDRVWEQILAAEGEPNPGSLAIPPRREP